MMGLTQVKGNTWVVEAMGLIPFTSWTSAM